MPPESRPSMLPPAGNEYGSEWWRSCDINPASVDKLEGVTSSGHEETLDQAHILQEGRHDLPNCSQYCNAGSSCECLLPPGLTAGASPLTCVLRVGTPRLPLPAPLSKLAKPSGPPSRVSAPPSPCDRNSPSARESSRPRLDAAARGVDRTAAGQRPGSTGYQLGGSAGHMVHTIR